MTKITSAQNDAYKKILSLTLSKGLKKEKLFLLSGEKLVREFLAKPNLKIIHEITAPSMRSVTSADALELSAELFAPVDVLGTHSNILVLEQPIPAVTEGDLETYQPSGLEIVLPIGDPGNLGALIRSCEAFGVSRVILTQEAAHPFLPKAVKASAGSVLRVSILYGPSLRDFPESCIALDMDGSTIDDFTWPENAMLVVGEEGAGLGHKKFSRHIRIPTRGVESLNVVVAGSIALAHWAGPK